MADFEEKKYSIDPGPGKKMDGCPYSNFEDGHDVQEYIIPPKGYVFSGFRFDPDAKNQIYDGKLYALYSKEPFKIRLKSNLWKFLLAIIIIVIIGLIALLASSVFRGPKSQNGTSKEPKTEVTTTSSKKQDKTDNSLSKSSKRKKDRQDKKEKRDKEEENKKTDNKDNIQPKQESVTKPQEPIAKPQEPEIPPQEPDKPVVIDPNVQFKQEFWDMIHQRNPSMDAFTDLYNNNKATVSGEEFDYLRYTILKDYVTFKDWYDKLRLIPEKQLSSISTIDELINKINQQQ